jgi:hypothetical protein
MAKRLFGIDIDSRFLRAVVAHEDKGKTTLVAATRISYASQEELLAALGELMGGERRLGDRVAAALPARDGFVRQLKFPFADPRKIAAAFELDWGRSCRSPSRPTSDFQQPVPMAWQLERDGRRSAHRGVGFLVPWTPPAS